MLLVLLNIFKPEVVAYSFLLVMPNYTEEPILVALNVSL